MNNGSAYLPGSFRRPFPGFPETGPADPQLVIEATIWLRPRDAAKLDFGRVAELGAAPPSARTYRSRSELRRITDAHPDDVALVRQYCIGHHLSIIDVRWRSIVARGTLGAFSAAFGATVKRYAYQSLDFRQRTGWITLPRELIPIVHAIFGHSEWPPVHPSPPVTPPIPEKALERAFRAADTASLYDFPAESDGSGETIGIVQFGGTFRAEDFAAAMTENGVATPVVVLHAVDGAPRSHHLESEFDYELMLDTQLAGMLAPGAKLVLYATPHSERGILDAIESAVFNETHHPGLFSISYGFTEDYWTPSALELFDELFAAAALVGMSVFCSSGDSGADVHDGEAFVRAPASSQFAVACGGTTLGTDPDTLGLEAAWELTGGGFSEYPAPPWQTAAVDEAERLGIHPGRGVPDVAAQAHPGYRLIRNGAPFALGGTSAVAPVWAALTARWNAKTGRRAGFFAPRLYLGDRSGMRTIAAGSNGVYEARHGWNPCTGWGSPIGTRLGPILGE